MVIAWCCPGWSCGAVVVVLSCCRVIGGVLTWLYVMGTGWVCEAVGWSSDVAQEGNRKGGGLTWLCARGGGFVNVVSTSCLGSGNAWG
jgi:hypothetical protein